MKKNVVPPVINLVPLIIAAKQSDEVCLISKLDLQAISNPQLVMLRWCLTMTEESPLQTKTNAFISCQCFGLQTLAISRHMCLLKYGCDAWQFNLSSSLQITQVFSEFSQIYFTNIIFRLWFSPNPIMFPIIIIFIKVAQ